MIKMIRCNDIEQNDNETNNRHESGDTLKQRNFSRSQCYCLEHFNWTFEHSNSGN